MAEEKKDVEAKEVKEKKAAPAIDEKVKEGKVLAALSYIWIIGVIVLLFTKRENDYVVFHAKQATTLTLGMSIVMLIPIIGWIIGLILAVVAVVGIVMAALGKRFEIPIVKEIASKMNI